MCIAPSVGQGFPKIFRGSLSEILKTVHSSGWPTWAPRTPETLEHLQ